ncbi:hypothetical protein Celaphus_00011829 [Cervus elaphus hippelaphus]|uniref:Uncharacterized protein n=1 Tax=Cervus elaphus hippelaphus TaxID=46360 RepID=A0A212CKK4_CEREH|nr:hypothetical protein Celaphus_00011829 [Cervus elaphus hippelaphus]
MNLPKGPDTLCFDKDEFMKVCPGDCAPRAEAGGLSSFPSGASSGCWAAHAPDLPPAGPGCLHSCARHLALHPPFVVKHCTVTSCVCQHWATPDHSFRSSVSEGIRAVILEQIVDSRLSDLQLMYDKLLEFVPHRCRLLREVTGGAISRTPAKELHSSANEECETQTNDLCSELDADCTLDRGLCAARVQVARGQAPRYQ